MVVALTGGTGFIGKRLISRILAQGVSVRLLTRGRENFMLGEEGLEIYSCDLLTASPADLENFLNGVEVLYHCSGQVSDVSLMHALHVDATRRLAEAARGRIKRWVQLSSVGVYGPISGGVVTEDRPFSPRGEYELTKAESELVVAEIAKKNDFELTVLRPSNVYGSTMTNRSLYGMITMIQKRLFFFIGKYGATANYIHVDNVAEAMLLCGLLPQAAGQTYNLSDSCLIEDFVATIAEYLKINTPRVRLPESLARTLVAFLKIVPNMPLTEARVDALTGRAVYSSDKIERELGYRHLVSMDDGLRDLVDYWRKMEFR